MNESERLHQPIVADRKAKSHRRKMELCYALPSDEDESWACEVLRKGAAGDIGEAHVPDMSIEALLQIEFRKTFY